MATVTRLCVTKSIPTVNGRFPGPKIVVREGDRLIVQVHNNINSNVTFHWYVSINHSIISFAGRSAQRTPRRRAVDSDPLA
jgi:hypothetical protein